MQLTPMMQYVIDRMKRNPGLQVYHETPFGSGLRPRARFIFDGTGDGPRVVGDSIRVSTVKGLLKRGLLIVVWSTLTSTTYRMRAS